MRPNAQLIGSVLLWLSAGCSQPASDAPSVLGPGGPGGHTPPPAKGPTGPAQDRVGPVEPTPAPMGPGVQAPEPMFEDEPKPVPIAVPDLDQANLATIESELDKVATLSTDDLLARRALTFDGALGYDPLQAEFFDQIQQSALALEGDELDRLQQQGFAIVPRRAFPHHAYGYKTIYALDLPVYVSLDAILSSVHLSYDAVLKAMESELLVPELQRMLDAARVELSGGAIADAQTAADVDLFLAVALSLVQASPAAPVAGASADDISGYFQAATTAQGIKQVSLFGVKRDMDFSQFEPRGHYAGIGTLEQYFRAAMWLGRTDLRLIETQSNGQAVFRRRQFEAALALRAVVTGPARAAFDQIDQVISAFVGEHDYMQLHELDALMADLGDVDVAELSDEAIAQAIIDGGYGAQRIASQVIFKDPAAAPGTLPLGRSFALLGQRYVVDSHVFSQVVFDRVPAERLLPDPLDAAYAALGNDAALPLLRGELETYDYAPQLERMRMLVDAHGDSYWEENLYNLWMSSLRAVSSNQRTLQAASEGLPSVTRSEAWQRRLLNTQLASWAELRHDTILYVKQSYGVGVSCEFPDGYVDPYPEAFEQLHHYALKGREVAGLLPEGSTSYLVQRIRDYFDDLAEVTATLRNMAEQERTGMPFNAEQMAFLNDAVRSHVEGCGGPETFEGWYARLLFSPSSDDMDPTIADVHTFPGGAAPPQVLHVATGFPRLLVVTVDTCAGPRAYAGVASAYHEVVTGLDRLTDQEWAPMAMIAADVDWMKPVLYGP